ncbi:metallophosphoesterase [Nocardioides pinisoli]|uniref:Metallophosphoesterase n=1 Tax=Nocardioides pinisoli TaxID=2950279 RepID=A0ABT1L271_9ACTN|nr:metallophosphoesterase [Nocardioides pinisoli]MCP3424087.1 metallophosphoesterase [Nocardioides pinisoli]
MPLLPVVRRTLGVGTLAGASLATYAAWEARQYTLRRVTVPMLPPGHAPLKVLHLSDIHMAPDQRAKQEWVRGLAALEPDLVIDTGDNLAHMRAVPVVADALGGLLDVPGVYVLGSNDYYAPGMRNPLLYLLPDTGKRNTSTPQLPWPDLKARFDAAGWLDLTNGFGSLTVRDTTIAFAGVDDPHLSYDDLERVAGPADPSADLRLAVAHAPYLRVLDQFAADGYDAIIAGHTHGGQVCLPTLSGRGRALTTNCDLEPARARGLHRHPADSAPGDEGSAWLHVSAGLGTNPYVRFRVACHPEATLLTLVPTG